MDNMQYWDNFVHFGPTEVNDPQEVIDDTALFVDGPPSQNGRIEGYPELGHFSSLDSLQSPIVDGNPLDMVPVEAKRITFGSLAWIKLKYLCGRVDGEVMMMGISSAIDPLYIEDVIIGEQESSAAFVSTSDRSISDLAQAMTTGHMDVPSHRFYRIWIHTHPHGSAQPSQTDEETFAKHFGTAPWAVMFILAKGGDTYARMRVLCQDSPVPFYISQTLEVFQHSVFSATHKVPITIPYDQWDYDAKTLIHPYVPIFKREDTNPLKAYKKGTKDTREGVMAKWRNKSKKEREESFWMAS